MKITLIIFGLCLLTGCASYQPDGEKSALSSRALSAPPSAPVPGTASFAWDSSQSGVTYSIYQGGVSQVYTNIIKGITNKTYTVTGLKPDARYYFVVAAVDASGIASKFSNEINYALATNTLPPTATFIDRVVFVWRNSNSSQPWRPVLTNDFAVSNKIGQYRVDSVQRLVR